ncbi:TetR/AcrR family transcriptional regulator [Pseudonocardia spinosispora]|uniref:TetR/AcrR family transcriptional regulator n=1 Tax=Pseudonocardia spinosispora TaxID=103441 RepID=UPI00041A5212|nr:TetR/AcrR family transcriptional regulator [Pseudonocardia spinosispora]
MGTHYEGDLRVALLDAAVLALGETGVDGLSLRGVARRIGVSHAAPAHHFGDKVGLLTAVAARGFELFTEHLAEALSGGEADPVAQLPLLTRAYSEFAENYPEHFDLMFRPASVRVEDPEYMRTSGIAFEALRAHLEECQRRGWRGEADSAALTSAAWALAHGIAVLRAHGSLARHYSDPTLDAVEDIAVSLLF